MSRVTGINILNDRSGEVLDAMKEQVAAGLEACGMAAENHAKDIIKMRPISGTSWYTRTGRLRNSITHTVREDTKTMYLGTNVQYAPYVEYGTGPYVEGGKGRTDVPWFYKDEEGKGHLSYGIPASHFLKNSIENHVSEYEDLIEKALRGRS